MSLMLRFTMLVAAALMAGSAMAENPVGYWQGTLSVGQTDLRIGINIERTSDGDLQGSADSPDQNAYGIPLSDINASHESLSFAVLSIDARYEAKWNVKENQWEGVFSQSGLSLPLILAAGEKPIAEESASVSVALPEDWSIPKKDEIAKLIDERIALRPGVGMVVATQTPGETRIVARGPDAGSPFDADTIFEIGSITKVFTALLLADLVSDGIVSLDDPVANYLPEGAMMPERGGKQITLRNLSQHDSGLPRLPDNMAPADVNNPYADYTEQQMLDFLASHELTREIGSRYEYSNLGAGLLGYALARASGTSFEELLRTRILEPLAMDNTAITLSAEQEARIATGHDRFNRPTSLWDLPALAGAGAMRSTAGDMLKFLRAALDPKSSIAPLLKVTLTDTREAPGFRAGLGWMILPEPAGLVAMHGGGTGGFRTHMALQPSIGRAVVVLTNSAVEPASDDVAMHMLLGAPLAKAGPAPAAPKAVARDEVSLTPAQLDRVIGTYRMSPTMVMTIRREGDQLYAAISGQGALPIFPRAPLEFFWRAVNAEIVLREDTGKITGATFSQDGIVVMMDKIK